MTGTLIKLPAIVDLESAHDLKGQMLTAFQGAQNITVDASEVERIGTQGLQLLWSAHVSFNRADLVLRFTQQSEAFLAAVNDAAFAQTNTFNSDSGPLYNG